MEAPAPSATATPATDRRGEGTDATSTQAPQGGLSRRSPFWSRRPTSTQSPRSSTLFDPGPRVLQPAIATVLSTGVGIDVQVDATTFIDSGRLTTMADSRIGDLLKSGARHRASDIHITAGADLHSCEWTETSCRFPASWKRFPRWVAGRCFWLDVGACSRQSSMSADEVDLAHAHAGNRTFPYQRLPAAWVDRDRAALHSRSRVLARRTRRTADRARSRAASSRPGAAHRPDRIGQVDDAHGDGRHHQRTDSRAHHHHRRPDRVPSREQAVAGPPARGRQRHRVVRRGACDEFCDRTRTSSSSASCETPSRFGPRCRPPRPVTSCSRRCTRRGRRRASTASSMCSRRTSRQQIRTQLGDTLQGVISQTLLPLAQTDGRTIATEVLINTPAVANMIREGQVAQLYSAMQAGSSVGMHTLDQDLRRLVEEGVIAQHVAQGVRRRPEEPRRRATSGRRTSTRRRGRRTPGSGTIRARTAAADDGTGSAAVAGRIVRYRATRVDMAVVRRYRASIQKGTIEGRRSRGERRHQQTEGAGPHAAGGDAQVEDRAESRDQASWRQPTCVGQDARGLRASDGGPHQRRSSAHAYALDPHRADRGQEAAARARCRCRQTSRADRPSRPRLARHPQTFPPLMLSIVRVGETGGFLGGGTHLDRGQLPARSRAAEQDPGGSDLSDHRLDHRAHRRARDGDLRRSRLREYVREPRLIPAASDSDPRQLSRTTCGGCFRSSRSWSSSRSSGSGGLEQAHGAGASSRRPDQAASCRSSAS